MATCNDSQVKNSTSQQMMIVLLTSASANCNCTATIHCQETSSREPSELSQWLCHDDSTINIDVLLLLLLFPSSILSSRFIHLFIHSFISGSHHSTMSA